MNNKTLRAILLSLGLLLAVFAILLMGGSPANTSIVVSTPAYGSQQLEGTSELESITDSAVPLAAPETVTRLSLTASAVRVDMPSAVKPVAEQPVAEQPVVEQPIIEEPAKQEPVSEEPAQQEPITEEPAIEEPAIKEPAVEEPAIEEPAIEEPVTEEPVIEEPATEEPVVKTSAAIRLLERANQLLTEYYACANTAEKRALLNASNNSLGNDAIRTRLLADLGGSWERLEDEVVDATEYQQDKTLYVQVYISDVSSEYVPVVYTTQNSDRSGNQWSTNLVYNDETATWMEYTQQHAYNNSRVGYYMTGLRDNEDGWEELKDTMETSDVWQPVVVAEATDAPAEIPADDIVG